MDAIVESIDYARLRVLVIEDEPFARSVVKQLLHRIGVMSIAEAEDGGSGAREALRTHPDVILCDVHMTPIDGIAFVERLRTMRIKGLDQTPVIMLTADAQRDTVLGARALDVKSYLVKPVDFDRLKAKLDAEIFTHQAVMDRVRRAY
jgi:two-component system, chemotaxis family, chemotaxis protein CheY